jgi:MFS family permease
MFAPSFFSGRLVARYGAAQVVLAGLLLCGLCTAVAATGTSVAHFLVGLILLGLGWNLAFIGVTTTLARAEPDERATVQGLNDLVSFTATALSSLLAGAIQHTAGWRAVNLAILPALGLAAIGVCYRLRAERADRAGRAERA